MATPAIEALAPHVSASRRARLATLSLAALGRRLRGHRHQPSLRVEGSFRRRAPSGADRPAEHPRHPFARVLVADDRRVDQVHRLHHARRQQGRGRHHGADGAGAARGQEQRPCAGADAVGPVRRRALLRRRHDHPGHLGALGGRGPRSRDAGIQALRDPDHAPRADRAVRVPEARHRAAWARCSARSCWCGSSPSPRSAC